LLKTRGSSILLVLPISGVDSNDGAFGFCSVAAIIKESAESTKLEANKFNQVVVHIPGFLFSCNMNS
jgi:hypothetical protein